MKTQIETAIDRETARAAELRERISGLERELAGIEGEIRGLEHARDLFGGTVEPAQRHAVQRVVMAALGEGNKTEAEIVAATNLPAESVHTFLLRAVRTKKLFDLGGAYGRRTE